MTDINSLFLFLYVWLLENLYAHDYMSYQTYLEEQQALTIILPVVVNTTEFVSWSLVTSRLGNNYLSPNKTLPAILKKL